MYEAGDKVIYQGADKNAYRKRGVVKSIEDKDGKPQLTVELEGGETFTAPIDDWSREFTNTYTNAKFKVGDRVTDGVETFIVKKVLRGNEWMLDDDTRTQLQNDDGYELAKLPHGYLKIKFEKADGLRLANACTSTNAVVRNAVAANRKVARNALTVEQQREFKSNILPKVERDVSAYEKGCKDVISSAKAIAAKISALAKEAKRLGGKVTELRSWKIDNLLSIYEYDESIGERLDNNFLDAKSSLYEARNAVVDAGYECVNAIKI